LKNLYNQIDHEAASDDGSNCGREEANKRLKELKNRDKKKTLANWEKQWTANDCNTEGPWHRNLNDTMFWM
jgi:hypothetical protein